MRIVSILLVIVLVAVACKKNQSIPESEILKDLSINIMKPGHQEFNKDVDSLFHYVNEMYSGTVNQYNLDKAKEHLISTYFSWNKINMFETEAVQGTYIFIRIQTWPTDTDYIVSSTVPGSVVDSVLIEYTSSRKKGLGAIEYLLFRDNALDSLQNASPSMDYLYHCTNLLKYQKNELDNLWNDSQYSDFESNSGAGVYTAFNIFYNAYVMKAEAMLHRKLGIPAGLSPNTGVDLSFVESNFALISLSLLIQDCIQMKSIFTGVTGKGFEDLCRSNGGDNTADLIISKWNSVQSKLEALGQIKLKDAIINNPTEIEAIFQEMKSLVSYLKYDLPQYIGGTLLYSSTDGD